MSPKEYQTIPLARPVLGSDEERAVCDVLRSGWVSQGPRVAEFEERLGEYLHCGFVRSVNSGTSALLLALKAVGVGPGDSVVVPAFTCAATALPVLALGAEVVFADISLETLNTTWDRIEQVIRPDTKAVIIVHLFGRMADVEESADECRRRGICLIEDAALALGAQRGSQFAGTVGVAGCFSFHPRKMITTGEGGAVSTNDARIAAAVESDRNYGAAVSAWSRFQENVGQLRGFERLAFNMKLTDLQAAVGLVQLGRLQGFIAERRRIVSSYRASLGAVPILHTLPPVPVATEDVHQAFVCLWKPKTFESLLSDTASLDRACTSLGIFRSVVGGHGVAISDAAQFLPELPVFRGRLGADHCVEACRAAYLATRLSFALPIYPEMSQEQVDRVIAAVRDGIHNAEGLTP